MSLDNLAVLEAEPEVLDQRALIAQRHAGVHDAFCQTTLGGHEAFLSGNVGVELRAVLGVFHRAAEQRAVKHANAEIGAVGGMIFKGFQLQVVQVLAAALYVGIVGFPCGDGIVIHARGGENSLPQLLDGGAGADAGEHLAGPCSARHSNDSPLRLAVHGIAVGLHGRIAALLTLAHLGNVHTLEAVGIGRDDRNAGRQHVGSPLQLSFLIAVEGRKRLEALMTDVQLGQGLIIPLHVHLAGAQAVQLFHHHRYEFRLIKAGINDNVLILLWIAAHLGDELGIFAQSGLLHDKFLLYGFAATIIHAPRCDCK